MSPSDKAYTGSHIVECLWAFEPTVLVHCHHKAMPRSHNFAILTGHELFVHARNQRLSRQPLICLLTCSSFVQLLTCFPAVSNNVSELQNIVRNSSTTSHRMIRCGLIWHTLRRTASSRAIVGTNCSALAVRASLASRS